MLRSTVPIAALTLLSLTACTAGRQSEIARLETSIQELTQQQQQRKEELEATTAELARFQFETKLAEAEAARSRCKAEVARIDAETKIRQAQCAGALAKYAACDAKNSARTAKSGMWGCMLGVAAGVLSGGSLAPITLAGCGGGALAGGASGEECGELPRCADSVARVEAEVLREAGLEEKPSCEYELDASP